MKISSKLLASILATSAMLGCSTKEGSDDVPAHIQSVLLVSKKAMQYEKEHGHYPESFDSLTQYDKSTPTTDYWGNDIKYEKRGDKFAVWSAGPDKQLGTPDDVKISFQPPEHVDLHSEMDDGEILDYFSMDENLANKTTVNGKDGHHNEYVDGEKRVIIARSIVSGVIVSATGTESDGTWKLERNGR